MKKRYFIIILLLICFIEVEAKNINVTFTEAKKVSNDYITNSAKHEFYLINANKLPFGFNDENKIEENSNFLKGGLLNLKEYEISFYESKSYLRPGINYWTMTNSDDGYYVIKESKNESSSIENKHQVRITEYVKKDTYVSGTGTYKDPWKFNKLNTIVFVSTDETKGTVLPKKQYAFTGENLAIEVNLTPGYEYVSNTCNITTASNNGINLYNVQDDMFCEVSFKEKVYTINYDNNGGGGCTSKQVKFNSEYGDLCLPIKKGAEFLGWFTDINSQNEVTSTTKVTQTDTHTLFAKWQNDLTCSELSDSIQCGTSNIDKTINYTGSCTYSCIEESKNIWKIVFKSSGELTLNSDISLDIFAVGGGGGGGASCSSNPGFYCQKGGGGGGGYTKTYLKQDIKAGKYHIEIGSGGSLGQDGSKSYFGSESTYKADGGKASVSNNGGNGGSGGGSGSCPICNGYDWGGCANYSSETGSGGAFGTSGRACGSLSAGKGQGTTTCEFGLGSSSGCESGVNSYSHGGIGSTYSNNTGNGGNIGGAGSTGVVIIRNNLVHDIVVNNEVIGTYTGTFKITEEDNNWKINFRSSGELKLNTSINVDLFLVGGGGGGGQTCNSLGPGYYCQSGGGGGSGYTKTYKNQTINPGTYWIEIGSGGSLGEAGTKSYFGNETKYFANGGNGATDAGGNGGSGGGSGSCPICNSYDWGGCANYSSTSGTGGKLGTNGIACEGAVAGIGQGTTTCEFEEGTLASCNNSVTAYAQGGMGAPSLSNSGNGGNVGNYGNSGIVIIRNKR